MLILWLDLEVLIMLEVIGVMPYLINCRDMVVEILGDKGKSR